MRKMETTDEKGAKLEVHLLREDIKKSRHTGKPPKPENLTAKKLLDECLTRTMGEEPVRLNGVKTSADLLYVNFPTFASDPTKRVPKQTGVSKMEDRTGDHLCEPPPPPHARRIKFSSTSTLFLQGTIAKPELEEILKCTAKALSFHINKGAAIQNKVYFDTFDENAFPLMAGWDTMRTPPESDVYGYMHIIFNFYKMDVECSIMSLIYIERMLEMTGMTIDYSNWRRVILSALIVASKVWQDYAVWTQDFLQVFNNYITVHDLNNLELKFLALIHYRLAISASTYAKYYYELRAYSHNEEKLPIRPLDKATAKRLEQRSSDITEKTRSMSLSEAEPPRITRQVVIN